MQVLQHAEASPTGDWAEQTRRVLTRDLLLRARRSSLGEARALEFRALHLNLPLIREVGDRLQLTGGRRAQAEHDGLEALLEAVRALQRRGIVFIDRAPAQSSERGALTQLYKGGVSFELVVSHLENHHD